MLLTPAAALAQGQVPQGISDVAVITGLPQPVGMAFLPDGRLLFIEQKTARVRLLVNGALAATDPVMTVPGVRTTGNEQGLLGIAVDPRWPAKPYIYVHYDWNAATTIHLSRFTATGDLTGTGNGALSIDPATRFELITDIPDDALNHNGGTLRFGPDSMLYESLGDDASGCPAQDTVSLRGQILRLDVRRLPGGAGGPPPRDTLVAAGNPFATHPNANARLVWALGLRNPFRFHIDPATGALAIGDVGENREEEMDVGTAPGRDYGWPLFEGDLTFINCAGASTGPFMTPVYEYPHVVGSYAVIGGPRYRAPAGATASFGPGYDGDIFFNDYYYGFLRRLKFQSGQWALAPVVTGQPNVTDWGTGFDAVSDWLIGPDGSLWYCKQFVSFQAGTGQIRRLVPTVALGTGAPGRDGVLEAPRPNPAQGSVTFAYTLARSATRIDFDVLDVGGRRVAALAVPAGTGRHEVRWDVPAAGLREGVYLVRLRVGEATFTRRFTLLR